MIPLPPLLNKRLRLTQPPPPTTAAPKISPRGQRLAQEIKYGDWSKSCFKPGGAKMTCRTTINGNWETGQQAVRLDVIEREDEGAARLQLFLPVGLFLPAGVKLSVDQGAPYSIPYTWCLANTCIAANVAEPKMIRELETGQKLVIEVVDTNILAVTIQLPSTSSQQCDMVRHRGYLSRCWTSERRTEVSNPAPPKSFQ